MARSLLDYLEERDTEGEDEERQAEVRQRKLRESVEATGSTMGAWWRRFAPRPSVPTAAPSEPTLEERQRTAYETPAFPHLTAEERETVSPNEQARLLTERAGAVTEVERPPEREPLAPEFRDEARRMRYRGERMRLEGPITDTERQALTYQQMVEQHGKPPKVPLAPVPREPTREEVIALRKTPVSTHTYAELEAIESWLNGPGKGTRTAQFLLPFAAIALLPVAWQFAPLLTAFVVEQIAEEAGAIPGKPIGKLLTLPAKPMIENLKDLGVPDDVATVLGDVITFGAIGKAKTGQKTLTELLSGMRRVSADAVARGVTAIESTRPGARLSLGMRGVGRVEGAADDAWIKAGVRARAADRGNLGTIVDYNPETRIARVSFYNRKTKLSQTVELPAGVLSPAGRGARPTAPRPRPTPQEDLALQERLRAAGLVSEEAPVPGATLEAVTPRPPRGKRVPFVAGAAPEREALVQKAVGALTTAHEAAPEFAAALHERRAGIAATMGRIAETGLQKGWTQEEIWRAQSAARRGLLPRELELGIEFTEAEGNELLGMVQTSNLTPFEKTAAKDAVWDLFINKQRLNLSQRKLLGKVFGEEFETALAELDKKGFDFWQNALDVWNLPRSVVASFDLSFPLRQGAVLVGRPGFYKALGPMVKSFADEDVANAVLRSILEHPWYESWAKPAGLAIADPGTGMAAAALPREEAFISRLTGTIWGLKHSQRAYTTAANKMRWDYFVSTIQKWQDLGVEFTTRDTRTLARWINIATGWGELGPAEKHVPLLATALFSPRFWASRIELLPYGIYLGITNPLMRAEVARDLASFTAMNIGLLGMMKLGGFDIELDPRSPDFATMRVGPARMRLLGGLQPTLRYGVQLVTGTGKATSGEIFDMDRFRLTGRHGQSKLNPSLGWVTDLGFGYSFVGEPLEWDLEGIKDQAWNRLAPMFGRDLVEAIKDGGWGATALVAPGVLGASTLVYESPWQQRDTARDDVSQERFGMGFEELTKERGYRAAADAVADDERVEKTEEDITSRRDWYGGASARRSMIVALEAFHTEQLEKDASIEDWDEWRKERMGRNERKAGKIAGLFFAHPDQLKQMEEEREELGDPFIIPEGAEPDDIVDRYLAIFTDHTNVQTGGVDDQEKLWDDIERFREILTPEQDKWLESNLGLKSTPREKEYRAISKIIREAGWWEVGPDLWETLAPGKPAWDDTFDMKQEQYRGDFPEHDIGDAETFVQLNMDKDLPEAKDYLDQVLDARYDYRWDNPKIEALLYHLGYIDKILGSLAADFYFRGFKDEAGEWILKPQERWPDDFSQAPKPYTQSAYRRPE